MSDIERDLIAGLQEFADKLKSGERITVTQVRRCEICDGNRQDCWCCRGLGFVSEEKTLLPKSEHHPEDWNN